MANSRNNSKRGAMLAHRDLVKRGCYEAARKVFWMLQDGAICLGLSDSCWEAELALESHGFTGMERRDGIMKKFKVDSKFYE